jgi:HPt (histidine-containing phosphotransfer) domain-containing protein
MSKFDMGPASAAAPQKDRRDSRAAPTSELRPFIDRAALMEHIDGDMELLRQIALVLADTAPGMLAKLRDGIAANQPAQVRDAAHAIRGAARNFFAPSVESAAMALEVMGSGGRLTGAGAALLILEAEVSKLQQALAALVQGQHR